MKLIAGVDEAGRGALAGPVVAAAVILPDEYDLAGLNDSKKVSPLKREKLFVILQQEHLNPSVESSSFFSIIFSNRIIFTLSNNFEATFIDTLTNQIFPDHISPFCCQYFIAFRVTDIISMAMNNCMERIIRFYFTLEQFNLL